MDCSYAHGLLAFAVDELRSAQPLMFHPRILGMFETLAFHILDFNTRVGQNMFYTSLVVVAKWMEVHG